MSVMVQEKCERSNNSYHLQKPTPVNGVETHYTQCNDKREEGKEIGEKEA